MKYASNNIRNILIAGHAGSGKTTLTEALVYFSGAAERMGRVEDGTTISDFDPEEAIPSQPGLHPAGGGLSLRYADGGRPAGAVRR